jgi:hypothetical protein
VADIAFRDVGKVYPGGTRAVAGLNLDVTDAEFVVLVGPSGCGKTTALRMVAGLESVTEGEVSIGGRVVNDVAPKDRDIAMVFQSYALYPHLSVADNMGFGLKLRKVDKKEIRRRVEEVIELIGNSATCHLLRVCPQQSPIPLNLRKMYPMSLILATFARHVKALALSTCRRERSARGHLVADDRLASAVPGDHERDDAVPPGPLRRATGRVRTVQRGRRQKRPKSSTGPRSDRRIYANSASSLQP